MQKLRFVEDSNGTCAGCFDDFAEDRTKLVVEHVGEGLVVEHDGEETERWWHPIHADCLKTWGRAKNSESPPCPTCKKPLDLRSVGLVDSLANKFFKNAAIAGLGVAAGIMAGWGLGVNATIAIAYGMVMPGFAERLVEAGADATPAGLIVAGIGGEGIVLAAVDGIRAAVKEGIGAGIAAAKIAAAEGVGRGIIGALVGVAALGFADRFKANKNAVQLGLFVGSVAMYTSMLMAASLPIAISTGFVVSGMTAGLFAVQAN